MTVMGAGLETLAGRVGGSWAGDTRAGQRKSAENNDDDGSWAGDTCCWKSRTKEVGREQ